MKKLFTLCLLAGSATASAQSPITITTAQFPATAATVDRFQPATATGLTAPQTGANRTWDYRSLTPQGAVVASPYAAVTGTPPFAGSVRTYTFSLALGPFTIPATAYQGFDAAGFSQLGSALSAQTFPLATITGGPNDVLTIPAQNIVVNTLLVPLPLSSTSRVVRASRVLNNSLLTVQAFGISQAPLRYVQRVTTVDSVAGWGTLRVPVAGTTTGSAAMPVLLVQRRYIEQDSFYLSGQPAPAVLLSALGQTQGSISRSFTQYFYRQNSAQYMLGLSYPDASFGTPTAAAYSAETNLALAATAPREVAAGGLTAWPNPVARGQAPHFSLANVAAGQLLRLTLRDATGRVVSRVVAPNGQPMAWPALPAGLYLAEAEAAGIHASRRVVIE
ncbi:hypothetical protein [Hymenobacter convexus]|uniref:hypothetical protein n=1 Tax=Hymenobacter sp. CA1UV-4 TaxID=3063782 RepID=UPI002712BF8D|nr:hypothetical protein [Hymenobacter sp. CA1UV-4]MDO7854027.1 hypothetical protein [Hymenobacter sp. CA1UV-4]